MSQAGGERDKRLVAASTNETCVVAVDPKFLFLPAQLVPSSGRQPFLAGVGTALASYLMRRRN